MANSDSSIVTVRKLIIFTVSFWPTPFPCLYILIRITLIFGWPLITPPIIFRPLKAGICLARPGSGPSHGKTTADEFTPFLWRKGVEKLNLLACLKEPSGMCSATRWPPRGRSSSTTTSRHRRWTRPTAPRWRSLSRVGNASLIVG